MIWRYNISLLGKVLGWLLLHLVILAVSFAGFVRWQLGMGLDSLLSGSAGDRLRAFGDAAFQQMAETPRRDWNEALKPLADPKRVVAAVFDFENPASFPVTIPRNVLELSKKTSPPHPPCPPQAAA
jgi:hypothetical protein